MEERGREKGRGKPPNTADHPHTQDIQPHTTRQPSPSTYGKVSLSPFLYTARMYPPHSPSVIPAGETKRFPYAPNERTPDSQSCRHFQSSTQTATTSTSFCSIPDICHPVLSGGAVTAVSRGGEGTDPEERVGGAAELATSGPDQQRRGCRYVQPKGALLQSYIVHLKML